ncbi:hypothetical protein NFJ07_06420 [Arthrobacter sp. B2a2-09]|nr:hypothetical protein [Arthrobacter sp. B2a2-09]
MKISPTQKVVLTMLVCSGYVPVTGRGAAVGAGAPAAVAEGDGAAGAGVLDGVVTLVGAGVGVCVGADVAVRVGADEAEGDELGREYEPLPPAW